MAIKTYEEFDRRREEIRGMSLKVKEVREHFFIFPKTSTIKEELYDTSSDPRRATEQQ